MNAVTDEERNGCRRELDWLRQRVDALEEKRDAEIGELRSFIRLLEQRLDTPEPSQFVARDCAPEPEPLPMPAPEPLPVAAQATETPPPFPLAAPEPPPFVAAPPVVVAEPSPVVASAPPPLPKGSLELHLGRTWLVRVGIALLVTGLVLLGNFAYKNWIRELPAGARLAVLYLGSFSICGTAWYLGTRETLRRFADVLMAGGLAFFYWCTYAMHHVPRLQVIESPVVAGVLLLGAAGVIAGVSLRRDSRATATMGLLLASYSTILQPLGWLSAISNVVLAGAGVAFMRRPGWAMPGVASMAGTYISFLWWQIAGGHGGGRPDGPAVLWFLPPVWAIFALPGVIGVSRHFSGLTDRGRGMFASANNVAFFALFSALWLQQRGSFEGYWMVPAAFGAVLLLLAVLRRPRDAAGGAHLAQGLGALTLAMTLKLEGYHLALAFAGQALALSLAFRKFAGRSELVFATLAAGAAMLISLDRVGNPLAIPIPMWSHVLFAILLAAAAFPLRDGCDRIGKDSDLGRGARVVTSLVFVAGIVQTLLLCLHHFTLPWRAPACGLVALGWSAFTLLRDPARRLPEAGWAALSFGFFGFFMLFPIVDVPWWSPVMAAPLALATHWLWLGRERAHPIPDAAKMPDAFLALSALTACAAVFQGIGSLELNAEGRFVVVSLAAVALVAVGRFLIASPILRIASTLLLLPVLHTQSLLSGAAGVLLFIPTVAALGAMALAGPMSVAGVMSRVAAGFSWLILWHKLAPQAWSDILAATGLLLAVVTVVRRGRDLLPEAWAFFSLAAAWMLAQMAIVLPWHQVSTVPGVYGALVLAAGFALPLLAPAGNAGQRSARHVLLLLASGMLALWSSQLMVWHFGWKPVAILWTALGFGLVSTGLWRKLSALRHAGFALLAVALVKLFALDVWDFGTFFRIAAFLALGVALVVLGFFYNRFADVLKKLLEGDEAGEAGEG
ncbi:DUF2339 domain-containing protein [Luteolibacter flavescens]|uniref:DUF2339 domain-containing protein n=1 Tax=Luteolibacter flavescens TaxID=1859460 RepID=A0ABT3FKE9_9BACT|nr:DUF2339 domain-containing protein [Luteolibacter flavescens]MCW1884063.1 DUF2339 domain-containing protein [Luteolibacter flavescens]